MRIEDSVFGHVSNRSGRTEIIRAPDDFGRLKHNILKTNELDSVKKVRVSRWCGICWHAAMKMIAFQAVRNGNGYVRPAFVSGDSTEAGRPSVRGLLLAGALLALTAT